MKRKVLIILLILIICYIIFVTIDCVRLENSKRHTKPLITTSIIEYENDRHVGTIYSGLGYSVKYYNVKNNSMGYGTTIKLFNIFTLYGIEAQ